MWGRPAVLMVAVALLAAACIETIRGEAMTAEEALEQLIPLVENLAEHLVPGGEWEEVRGVGPDGPTACEDGFPKSFYYSYRLRISAGRVPGGHPPALMDKAVEWYKRHGYRVTSAEGGPDAPIISVLAVSSRGRTSVTGGPRTMSAGASTVCLPSTRAHITYPGYFDPPTEE